MKAFGVAAMMIAVLTGGPPLPASATPAPGLPMRVSPLPRLPSMPAAAISTATGGGEGVVSQTAAGARIALTLSDEDRDAIGRVAFAEAGNQAEEGLAGVIFTILNRLHAGAWGGTVAAVLDAPDQFEPVMRAGGQWQALPTMTSDQAVEFNTILDLILQGRVPDPTNGALYFQNPVMVAARAAAGEVSPALVNFGGQTPIAVIRDHAFYARLAGGDARAHAVVQSPAIFADGSAAGLLSPEVGQAPSPVSVFVPVTPVTTVLKPDAGATVGGLFAPMSPVSIPPAPSPVGPSHGATDPR